MAYYSSGTFGNYNASHDSHCTPLRGVPQRFVKHPEITLFQSLDDFSPAAEPLSMSPYECLPTSYDDSRSSVGMPRMVSDIWSHDSVSTVDSNDHAAMHTRTASRSKGFIDYSHLMQSNTDGREFNSAPSFAMGGRPVEGVYQNRSIVLHLSSLIN